MLGSIGVIAGAIAIRFTGMTWIDPVVAVGIGLWVLLRTWILLRDTANVLLEGVQCGMFLDEVRRANGVAPGVQRDRKCVVWDKSEFERVEFGGSSNKQKTTHKES